MRVQRLLRMPLVPDLDLWVRMTLHLLHEIKSAFFTSRVTRQKLDQTSLLLLMTCRVMREAFEAIRFAMANFDVLMVTLLEVMKVKASDSN